MFETANRSRGSFNPIMLDCFLVHLCEFSRKNSFAYEAEIKNIVTDSTIIIRDLHKSPFQINSYHRIGALNLMMYTLESSNRRYVIITSSEKIGDTALNKDGIAKQKNIMVSSQFFMKRKVNEMLDFHSLELSDYQKHLMQYTTSKASG